MKNMNFKTFHDKFLKCFTFEVDIDEEIEQDINDYYTLYKEEFYKQGETVEFWCKWFFHEFTIDKHGFELKNKTTI